MASSKLLTGLAIGLYLGSTVSAVLATRRLDGKPLESNEREYIKAYIPASILFVTASAMLVVANVRDTHRIEALAGAYSLTRDALDDLKSVLPEKVLAKANEQIIQKQVETEFNIPPGQELLVQPNAYCFDSTTGQSFILSVERIHKACQNLNYQIIHQMGATMDDYCDELGLEHISGGTLVGWDYGPLVFHISTRLKDDTLPVVVILAEPLPHPLYA